MNVKEYREMVAKGEKSPSYLPYSSRLKKSKPSKRKKPNLVRKVDTIFSKYIRLRDCTPHGTFRCISCGKFKNIRKADCGHFYSRVHMATRFDEDNAHAECSFCNRVSADHLIAYQENLIRKIGQDRFDSLRVKHNQTKHWSDFELEELYEHYKKEVARLSEEKGVKL